MDCQHCVEEKGKKANPAPKKVEVAKSEPKGRGGRRKSFSTEGYFCSNKRCEYYGIRDEQIQALVGDGSYGKHEENRDLKCQSCWKKFTIRKHTILYRLKTHSETVEKILWLLAVGSRWVGVGGSIWGAGDHDPVVVMAERDAG
jgi:hypothetical protein